MNTNCKLSWMTDLSQIDVLETLVQKHDLTLWHLTCLQFAKVNDAACVRWWGPVKVFDSGCFSKYKTAKKKPRLSIFSYIVLSVFIWLRFNYYK